MGVFTTFFNLVACKSKPISQIDQFAKLHHLDKYDSTVVVSLFTCQPCVQEFYEQNKNNNAMLWIFDEHLKYDFLKTASLNKLNLTQDTLDAYLGKFGNMIIITRDKDAHYISRHYPQYEDN